MKQISNCCKAEVKPNREDLQRGETYYNVCTKCGKPCDLYVENEIGDMNNEGILKHIEHLCFMQAIKKIDTEDDNIIENIELKKYREEAIDDNFLLLTDKINEIIDVLNKKGNSQVLSEEAINNARNEVNFYSPILAEVINEKNKAHYDLIKREARKELIEEIRKDLIGNQLNVDDTKGFTKLALNNYLNSLK